MLNCDPNIRQKPYRQLTCSIPIRRCQDNVGALTGPGQGLLWARLWTAVRKISTLHLKRNSSVLYRVAVSSKIRKYEHNPMFVPKRKWTLGFRKARRRSQCSRGLRRRFAVARLLGLRVRIPPGAWMSVSCECCVLSGRGLCVRLITRPEESYREWCVWVWSWSLDNEAA
jgi:hypothetical protein